MDRLISLYNGMIERLRNERLQLEEQHFFLHKLLKATPSGIVILDYDGRVEYINPGAEQLIETSKNELAGKTLKDHGFPFTDALDKLETDKPDVIPLRGNRRMKCIKSKFIDRGFQRHFILIEELTDEIRQSEKSAYGKLIRLRR